MRQERAEAVQLARQAGIRDHEWLQDQYDAIERLVLLAKEEEREACAKVCEAAHKGGGEIHGTRIYFERCADAIRGRSNGGIKAGA